MQLSARDLARHIEHTLVMPDATARDVERWCAEAREHAFATVCVNPSRVLLAHHHLLDSDVKLCAVVGFPFGGTEPEIKAHEAELAIDLGANEIEVVLNLGRLKDGDDRGVLRELRDVVEAANELPVKVVVESSRLASAERLRAASLIVESGARFLVTGTGYGNTSAADVRGWRELVGKSVSIKAVGGIRDAEMALQLIEAGADRLGTAEGPAIVAMLAASHGRHE